MKIKYLIVFVLTGIFIFRCRTAPENADFSLDQYRIEEGFEMQLIAAEPLIEAPVAMDFDNKGRIWIVEMRG